MPPSPDDPGDDETSGEVISITGSVSVAEIQKQINAIDPDQPVIIRLEGDITPDAPLTFDRDVTIDLNGYVINS